MINISIDFKDANAILSLEKCGDLFSNDRIVAKKEFRQLAWIWFPDNLPSSKKDLGEKVFKKINFLYEEAKKCFENNTWEESNVIFFNDLYNKKYKMKCLKQYPNEIGNVYINDNRLMYVIDKDKEKYYHYYMDNIKQITYADDKMKKEFSRFLPNIKENFISNDKSYIVLYKTPDVFFLRDVLNYYNNQIPHYHAAWVVSRLLNLLCFLEFNNLAHNGITIDNCFISPKYHSIMIYGGWSYAKKIGEKMVGVPKEVFEIMSINNKKNKISEIRTDIESVKMIARILLGNKSVAFLPKDIPEPFKKWLINSSKQSAFEEFDIWTKVITDSYGKRNFREMNIDINKIYN